MVNRGEHHVSILVEIIVFFLEAGPRASDRRPDMLHRLGRIIHFKRKSRHGLKTTPAQARRVETRGGQSPKDLTRHDDFVTPARPLVKMTFRHSALVVPAAHRALFVRPQ
jgi:hypothetical protein